MRKPYKLHKARYQKWFELDQIGCMNEVFDSVDAAKGALARLKQRLPEVEPAVPLLRGSNVFAVFLSLPMSIILGVVSAAICLLLYFLGAHLVITLVMWINFLPDWGLVRAPFLLLCFLFATFIVPLGSWMGGCTGLYLLQLYCHRFIRTRFIAAVVCALSGLVSGITSIAAAYFLWHRLFTSTSTSTSGEVQEDLAIGVVGLIIWWLLPWLPVYLGWLAGRSVRPRRFCPSCGSVLRAKHEFDVENGISITYDTAIEIAKKLSSVKHLKSEYELPPGKRNTMLQEYFLQFSMCPSCELGLLEGYVNENMVACLGKIFYKVVHHKANWCFFSVTIAPAVATKILKQFRRQYLQ